MASFEARHESWPLAKPFAISRGTKTAAEVVVCEIIMDEGVLGRGECVPYARYGETVEGVIAEIESRALEIARHPDRIGLLSSMPAGAARNAIDCALWDLQAKLNRKRAWEIAGIHEPAPAVTAETISIGTPEEMAAETAAKPYAKLIKIKLDGENVVTRVAAVREAAPEARLIVDPNEGWDIDLLREVAPPLADLGVEMLEQPLPADDDDGLKDYDSPIPICADESCHTADKLGRLGGKYQIVNIKLDKTGGLTSALRLADAAHTAGFDIMVGCMVGTSLAMAPATLLTPYAKFVDLDGPLLLKQDRPDGLDFSDGLIHPPAPELWG
ncbi:MAG: L-Ala-D/L-Glu epimerase [Rhodospirillales bacterium]